MPSITTQWVAPWLEPWGGSLALDGLVYGAGSITYSGDSGLRAPAGPYTDMYGATIAAQSWPAHFDAASVTVTFSRTGGVGSMIELAVFDADETQVGYVAPVAYPGGPTTVVIPVSPTGRGLLYFQLLNTDYPSLAVDIAVVDLFASAGAVSQQWTNFLGCGES